MSNDRVQGQKWGNRGPAWTYAVRLARMHYLAHCFPHGHPVLDIEKELVQMAEAELREAVMKAPPGSRMSRPRVDAQIREVASERIGSLVQDGSVKKTLVDQIGGFDLDRVLSG